MSDTRSLEFRGALHGDVFEVEIVADPDLAPSAPIISEGVAAIAAAQRHAPRSVSLRLAADHPVAHAAPLPDALADATGFGHRRDLLQLRRPLPVPAGHAARSGSRASVRLFAPDGTDDDAWIRVNNRAFAHHADQGGQTRATLARQQAERWYDRSGFLVVDDAHRRGELAGFCWTKVHRGDDATAASLGEIYVIGVDPDRAGDGLGVALVLAGLDHMASAGIGTALLYVDADNQRARQLYERLGFEVFARRRVYTP